MVKQSAILYFVLLLGLFACKGKEDKHSSASINEVVRDIAKTNVLMGAAVGIVGERPKQWDRYQVLRLKASDKELIFLTNDTNAVVRCYAFQAIAERKKIDIFNIVLQHLSDTATVHTFYGCIGSSKKVGDFFLQRITESYGNNKYEITAKQKATIDSLLLFGMGNDLEARDMLLSAIEPIEKYYIRIRQIAIEENNKVAVVALSKYRNEQDKPLIEQMLNDPNSQTFGFAAVVNFPDASFYPVLQQTLKNIVSKNISGNDERLQMIYQAIVQYKNQPSKKLLKIILEETEGMQLIYHKDYLHQALKLYPATIYDGLLEHNLSANSTKKSGT